LSGSQFQASGFAGGFDCYHINEFWTSAPPVLLETITWIWPSWRRWLQYSDDPPRRASTCLQCAAVVREDEPVFTSVVVMSIPLTIVTIRNLTSCGSTTLIEELMLLVV
jgi:hypothetical protein